MTTLTCGLCDQTWDFEQGVEPPDDWVHGCQTVTPELTARDMETDLSLVLRQLNGREGTVSYMLQHSTELQGVKLALDKEEFKTFVHWVRESQQAGS